MQNNSYERVCINEVLRICNKIVIIYIFLGGQKLKNKCIINNYSYIILLRIPPRTSIPLVARIARVDLITMKRLLNVKDLDQGARNMGKRQIIEKTEKFYSKIL